MTNQERFTEAYSAELTKAITLHPEQYLTKLEAVPDLAERMTKGLITGSANLSDTARKAAKKLGISPTYKGIREFCQP